MLFKSLSFKERYWNVYTSKHIELAEVFNDGFLSYVSPEQGPIARNSTITVATVKYLLEKAIKSNKLLDNKSEGNLLFVFLLKG